MDNPETKTVNPLEFPVEYFDAQVQFAYKWSEVSGEDLASTLLTKTALYRRIAGTRTPIGDPNDDWDGIVSGIDQSTDPDDITRALFRAYSNNPNSKYHPPEHQSAFGYDYLPDTKTVKIHFTNPHRGERPLSNENMAKRRDEFRSMLENVRREHPEAALLMSATWLRSTAHYRELSPPDINPQEDLMSPDMKLTGNSVWGQFVDASGNINQRVYDQFIKSVASAKTPEELMEAFPYKTLRAVDSIDKYFRYYGIDNA